MNNPSIPSFSIYKPNSTEKVDTLRACFIERYIFPNKHFLPANLVAKDGNVYQAVYDCQIPSNVVEFKAIVSFQQHTYGKFAIVRIAKDKKPWPFIAPH